MVAQTIVTSAPDQESFVTTAARMGPERRQGLSLQVLSDAEPVTAVARQHGVSRKFVYQQSAKASKALDQAFAPAAAVSYPLAEYGVAPCRCTSRRPEAAHGSTRMSLKSPKSKAGGTSPATSSLLGLGNFVPSGF